MSTGISTSSFVKALALEAGFDLVGVARLAPRRRDAGSGADEAGLDQAEDLFAQWIAEGRHGGMEYLARGLDKRCDPQEVLAGARSIIMLASAYDSGEPNPARHGHGRVSRYAWGDDYHEILLPPLRQLESNLNTHFPGHHSRGYVDTGPVLEKVWAQRAGLGWIGHNGCLITTRFGSWVFLAALLTTLEIAPDADHPDRCGDCRACLPACPSGAILGDRRIDARRCISYTTIEHKGPIPAEMHAPTGDWILGCDDCQLVCPWNEGAERAKDPRFAPRPALRSPSLAEILRWRDEDFWAARKASPIARAKRRGLLRNAAVAAGNAGGEAMLRALRAASEDNEPLVREQARAALDALAKDTPGRSP